MMIDLLLSLAKRFVALAVAATCTSCALLESVERELVFRPVAEDWSRYQPGMLQEEELRIPVGPGSGHLHAWWLASPGATHTIVFLHGARVNLSGSVYRLRGLRDAGYNVLAIDYRGYGRSSPVVLSEQSVVEDALAAWRWLDDRVPDRSRRILYGHSLGAAVAVATAARGGGAGAMVLESAFTSVRELTVLGGFVTQRFEVLDDLAKLQTPVVVLHGKEDALVPVGMAQRLYDAARGPKRLILVDGAGHSWVVARARDELRRALGEVLAERR